MKDNKILEIERKFLVKDDSWRNDVIDIIPITQQYLSIGDCNVRVRWDGNKGYITLKLPHPDPSTVYEFEHEIPLQDVTNIARYAKTCTLAKDRHILKSDWTVDVFYEPYLGLVMAEIEMADHKQEIILPSWIGEEVTNDPEYSNVNLASYIKK